MPEKKNGKNRITVIGPVYPFKGGISHYTGLLVKSLKERVSVRTVSYKMQYPKFLFKKEQRDYGNDRFRIEDARFLINTANPFNIIRTAGIINKEKPELVIIQWWHPYFAPCYRILTAFLKSPVLFICHNVFPHERFIMDRFLTKLTLKKGDFFILHSEKEVAELKSILPEAKYRVNMHPTYSAFKTGEIREKKDKEKRLLFFGLVRPYKGLKVLLMALKDLPDVKLTVAGDFGGTRGEYEELLQSASLKDRVRVFDGYVPDNEIQGYFEDCDAAVLPYIDATQSGIAQVAFGFEKPVIATRVGGLPEVVRDGETGILTEAGSAEALREGIERFYSLRDSGTDFRANIRNDSGRFSWDHLSDTIFELASIKGD